MLSPLFAGFGVDIEDDDPRWRARQDANIRWIGMIEPFMQIRDIVGRCIRPIWESRTLAFERQELVTVRRIG